MTGGWVAPRPAIAAATDDAAARILARINSDRAAAGLVPYRPWGTLQALAAERAGRMAATRTLSHAAAGGSIGTALDARSVDWLSYGEVIGKSPLPPGEAAADQLYEAWHDSAPHRAILSSTASNYIGVAVARAADGTTWASAVMTESPDHTAPVARNGMLTRSGNDLTFRWSGFDPRLQSHTAGLHSFDVQFRRDDRTWRTIRDDTTATSVRRLDRARGHWYYFRVRAKDRRGTLSGWTAAARIWVP